MSEIWTPPVLAAEPDSPEISADLKVSNRFLNEWRESIARSTDASDPLVIFSGIGLLSCLCHRFYFHSPRETYLNLYLFILGKSSTHRKTTMLDIVRDYVAKVDEELILPNEFTAESFFTCLADRSHGTVFSRELNAWLDQMLGPDYNKGLASSLGNLYDHAHALTRQTQKHGFKIIRDPVISILGVGVDEYLIAKLREMDLISGFWPRVTLVQLPPRKAGLYLSPGQFYFDENILSRLGEIHIQAGGEMSYANVNAAREAYAAQLYKEAAEIDNNNLASGYARLEWILVKIAALCELADNPESREIGPAALYDAMTLVDYIKQYLPDFYGERLRPDPEDKLAAWVLNFIKKHDKGGTVYVPYRMILQHSHTAAGKVKAAIARLLALEKCEHQPTPAHNGGPKTAEAYRSLSC